MTKSNFSETIRAALDRLDQLDLDRRVEQVETTLKGAVGHAGEYVHNRRENIERLLDNATIKVNERTEGKYADQVTKVRGHVETGLDKLADKREDTGGPPPPQGPAA